jgi:hypothetical protein
MSLNKLSSPGIIKLFPARESLVSDIPAGDGKNDNLFSQCIFSESCAPTLCETFFVGITLTLFNGGNAAVLQVQLPHWTEPQR